MSVERDQELIRLYVNGMTLHECSQHFKRSHERIRQILRKAGVWRGRESKLTERDVFLGVNLTEQEKNGVREEAARRGISMSVLTADLIKDMLAKGEA